MFIKLFLITLPVFFAIDIIWLVLIARKFYQKNLGFMMKTDINWYAAGIFYLIFIAGLVTFVISPSVEKQSHAHSLVFGALFGLITYSTYDLTNLATLKDWPVIVTIADLAWGMILSSLVSVIVYFIAMKFLV